VTVRDSDLINVRFACGLNSDVGEREQPLRNLEAEGLGSLEVDYQLIFRRLLHVSGTDREP